MRKLLHAIFGGPPPVPSRVEPIKLADPVKPEAPIQPAEPVAPKPAKANIVVGLAINDFAVFRSVLFVRGAIERRGEARPTIALVWPDGTEQPMVAREDDFIPSNGEFWSFAFSQRLSDEMTGAEIARIGVVFEYPEGRLLVTDPTADVLRRDDFLSTEHDYWAAVSAAPTANVLEIGSRARSGISRRQLFPGECSYTGFDILPGENVTVVGDAHALSRALPANHFDFVFSVAVWEHLAMPWLVSLELNKVMKLGGLAMITTHQSWPLHEEPCDYFRFSEFAWDPLFNTATGFEIVKRGMGSRCIMGPAVFTPPMHANRMDWHYGFLATRVVVKKVSETTLSWPVDLALVSRGAYPY